jgi:hypothetical protein
VKPAARESRAERRARVVCLDRSGWLSFAPRNPGGGRIHGSAD